MHLTNSANGGAMCGTLHAYQISKLIHKLDGDVDGDVDVDVDIDL